jgi:carotenoid cleavage dioxygenase-like enzyme
MGTSKRSKSEILANPGMADHYFISQNSETELTKVQVDGSLPTWLNGKPVRNGPAIFEAGSTKLRHWFVGFGPDAWPMILVARARDLGQCVISTLIVPAPAAIASSVDANRDAVDERK